MALSGNAFGPILVMLLVFFPYMAVRYWQFMWAYRQGTNLMQSLGSGGIARITELATIVGLIVIGGFAPSIVSLTTPLEISRTAVVEGEEVVNTVNIQAQLDAVLPYMLPLLVTGLAYWLLKRGWKPIYVILVLIAIGFIGGALGILG
jgi:mannose/fructose/N-acetylgalactosamine-specific phosphotransferase system component IID